MREAIQEDCVDLELLEAQIFPENCFNAHTLHRELEHGRGWVVERDGLIVAYLLARVEPTLLDILRVGVLEEHRGQGLGTQLVQRAMQERPETVLQVRKENHRALLLYRRLGFAVIAEAGTGEFSSWVLAYRGRLPNV